MSVISFRHRSNLPNYNGNIRSEDLNKDSIINILDSCIKDKKDIDHLKNIEVVIPVLKHNDAYEYSVEVIPLDGMTITIYDDFYTFKGAKYTDEARRYLSTFDTVDCSYSNGVFKIWYRLFYDYEYEGGK